LEASTLKVTRNILTKIFLITPPETWVCEKNPTVRFKIWICWGVANWCRL